MSGFNSIVSRRAFVKTGVATIAGLAMATSDISGAKKKLEGDDLDALNRDNVLPKAPYEGDTDLKYNHSILVNHTIKDYNLKEYSGMRYLVLEKNVVDGVNTLTQEMINSANTVYVIQYDFFLGTDIVLPARCVLKFEGGSMNNGTLTLNGAIIESKNVKIFDNLIITPENYLAIRTSWFGLNGDEDCSAVFTNLLNSIQTNSTLYVDSFLRFDNPVVAPARLLYSRIIGAMDNNDVINPPMITSTIHPSTSEDMSLISIRGEGVHIENISIKWESDINTLQNTYILNLTPRGQEGDHTIKNCFFNKWFASAGAVLRHKGRGLYVNNCTFNCIGMYAKDDIPPSAIELEGAGGAETTPDFIIPENSMRRIIIEDNFFHSGFCYMVKFLQNPDNESTTYLNACIRNNSCDVNMGCIYSNARHRGLLFTNNMVTGITNGKIGNRYSRNFEFHNFFDGIKISNNSFMNYKDRKSNGEIGVLFNKLIACGSIEISNNYYDLSMMSSILSFSYREGAGDCSVESIIIKDNILSKNTYKYDGESTENSIFSTYHVTIDKIVCMYNLRNSSAKKDKAKETTCRCSSVVKKGIILFNEGFNDTVNVPAGSSVIKGDVIM